MWKEIWKALRRGDVVTQMIGRLAKMLDAGQWMFEQASETLLRETDWSAIADHLYARDRQINEIEQDLRGRIVTHLSVGNPADVTACLVLMSVVKDAERIGDYCKNIFEVAKFYRREFKHPEFAGPLTEIRKRVQPLFKRACGAISDSDSAKAEDILKEAGALSKQCDLLIRQLLGIHEQLAPDEAVAYVLLARFYKRVACHLANIATSVVSPVPMLDYRDGMPNE